MSVGWADFSGRVTSRAQQHSTVDGAGPCFDPDGGS